MRKVSKNELLAMFPETMHEALHERINQNYVRGVVAFENLQLDSSRCGHRTAVVFGEPYTIKNAEDIEGRYLNDLPSARQYPVAFYQKSDE